MNDTFQFGRNQFVERRPAETCHWCEAPALKQEIDGQTHEYVGACKKHLDRLKPFNRVRQGVLNTMSAARGAEFKEIDRLDKRGNRIYVKAYRQGVKT